jgi:hypothetical protein
MIAVELVEQLRGCIFASARSTVPSLSGSSVQALPCGRDADQRDGESGGYGFTVDVHCPRPLIQSIHGSHEASIGDSQPTKKDPADAHR